MMKHISVALTEKQIVARTKTVTRRLGKSWLKCKPGTLLQAVNKCMGFKKGEHPRKIAVLRVVSVSEEFLHRITQDEVIKEGFPEMSVARFVAFFSKNMKCKPDEIVTRIEFEYVDGKAGG